MQKKNTRHTILKKRVALSLTAFVCLFIASTVAANLIVERSAEGKVFSDIKSVPHRKVALLLGTSPLNRLGRPNTYFTNRILTAAELYRSGKIDYIIASGDNHTRKYDETTAMRDSLIARGVPSDRIITDFAGFRTLDSVVRAKEVFGCDSLTIISQADHDARALYIAKANGIDAVEWLARDRMMLDLLFGRKPHFLGEKIPIPDIEPDPIKSRGEGS